MTLSDIIRQKEEWQRQAVKDFAVGGSRAALNEYATRGLVYVSPDRDAAKAELLSKWKDKGMQRPEENLILTSTNADAVSLNREIQRLRQEEGFVRERWVELGGERFLEGDRVLFTRKSTALGVQNGTLGTIRLVHEAAGRLTVQLDGGDRREFSGESYHHLKLGYAVTTHKAQGMTAENAYLLTHESMQDREISYVQASRARGQTQIFTTTAEAGENLSALSKTMERSHRQEMAMSASRAPSSTPSRSHSSGHGHSHSH